MQNKENVRQPVVAGMFYEGEKGRLKKQVDGYLAAGPEKKIRAKGVLSPHAGYVYSGAVAGKVFSSVEIPGLIIILGPNHTGLGKPISVYSGGAWLTPLGPVKVDGQTAADIIKRCPGAQADETAHSREHSIEVQLPFLQSLREDISIVAICVRESNRDALTNLAGAVAGAIEGREALIIASSDMTHYESAENAREKDEKVLKLIKRLDAEEMYDTVVENSISMCGVLPAYVMIKACAALGAKRAEILKYSNSGEVSGDLSEVVGYAGAAVI